MDFRKLAQFVLLAGFVAFAYGGFKYLQANAEAKKRTEAAAQQMGFFGAVLGGMDAATEKQAAQKAATQFMIVGGVIIFFGFAVAVSVKKPKESSKSTT